MLVRRAAALASVVTVLLAAACGGGAPTDKPPVTPKPEGADGPAAAATKTPSAGAEPGKTAADHHREFMQGCSTKAINSPDYCECAWAEFRKVFTDDEMSSTAALPKDKLEKVKGQVAGACSSKIPEETIKTGYDEGCVGEHKEMKPYCDCTWAEFRKRFSPAELGDAETVKGDRFLASRGPVVKACSTKMPEATAKDVFVSTCAKDPKAQPFCTCAWKELRKTLSAAEIQAAVFDESKVMATLDKACGKLRPKP